MALNYEDREALRPRIVSRCKEAVRKYALYLLGLETPTTAQKEWAENTMPNLDQWAENMSHYVLSETDYINNGTSISDASIQSRIESVLNEFFIIEA